jgi:hypothetical protein
LQDRRITVLQDWWWEYCMICGWHRYRRNRWVLKLEYWRTDSVSDREVVGCLEPFSEILRFSEKYLHPKQRFSEKPLTKNLRILENRQLSRQPFSEILRISETVWPETHKNLK